MGKKLQDFSSWKELIFLKPHLLIRIQRIICYTRKLRDREICASFSILLSRAGIWQQWEYKCYRPGLQGRQILSSLCPSVSQHIFAECQRAATYVTLPVLMQKANHCRKTGWIWCSLILEGERRKTESPSEHYSTWKTGTNFTILNLNIIILGTWTKKKKKRPTYFTYVHRKDCGKTRYFLQPFYLKVGQLNLVLHSQTCCKTQKTEMEIFLPVISESQN